MSALASDLEEYLVLRRSLGYKLERAGELLTDFVAYADRLGVDHISTDMAVSWATMSVDSGSGWRAQRLGVVRVFARYLHALDPGHEIPAPGLLPRPKGRPAPFVYSDGDVAALMDAARQLRSPLRSATLETLIGLLAVTGLRVGEVMRLDRRDVDLDGGLLLVRNSKGGKSRELPLHPSTVVSLRAYSARRDALFPRPQCAAFFISTAGTRLLSGSLRAVFDDLAGRAGLLNNQQRRRPRLGELRHSFAMTTLTGWHRDGIEIGPRLPLLSSFLGHVNPASTYWYLSAGPELLTAAARRLDQLGTSR